MGIGISPAVKLDVNGVVAAGNNTAIGNGSEIGRLAFYSRDVSSGASGSRGHIRLVNDSGLTWSGTASQEDTAMEFYTVENRTTQRMVMRLTSAGNVGIGINQPLSKVHIQDGNAQLQIGQSAANSWKFWGGLNLHIRNSSNDDAIIVWENKDVTIGNDNEYTSAHSKLRIRGGDIRLSYGYGIRVGRQDDFESWPTGTTHLIKTGWKVDPVNQDYVEYYVPGSMRSEAVMTTYSSGKVEVHGELYAKVPARGGLLWDNLPVLQRNEYFC